MRHNAGGRESRALGSPSLCVVPAQVPAQSCMRCFAYSKQLILCVSRLSSIKWKELEVPISKDFRIR